MGEECLHEDCAYYKDMDKYGCARGTALDHEACYSEEKLTVECPHCGKPVPVITT